MSAPSYEVKFARVEVGTLCRYDEFAFDITEALEKGVSGVHELAVSLTQQVGDHGVHSHVPMSCCSIAVDCEDLKCAGTLSRQCVSTMLHGIWKLSTRIKCRLQ